MGSKKDTHKIRAQSKMDTHNAKVRKDTHKIRTEAVAEKVAEKGHP